MSRLLIEGLHKLDGEICVHGAKNSVLPILAATILCSGDCVIHNCPRLSDVEVTIRILKYLGCSVKREENTLIINSDNIDKYDIPDILMREMRSSIIFLGAIVSRMRKANLSFPGGCELGARPIDIHLEALKQMGLIIEEYHGCINCKADKKLKGSRISLSFPSVGATENIILAAVLADGTTIINNAAREPEIWDLCTFLSKCGAKINIEDEGTIIIEGVERLNSTYHDIIPDRIVAATIMSAAAITNGSVTIDGVFPAHLNSVIPIFEEMGCKIVCYNNKLMISAPRKIYPVKTVRTMPYPGFPTDAQAPVMAVTTIACGNSLFVENIFESRYKHVGELLRLGANIKVEGKVAIIDGVKGLSAASVESTDLRGGAALVVAGLAAEGMTEVKNLAHIDRGYESIENSLSSIGAVIKRV